LTELVAGGRVGGFIAIDGSEEASDELLAPGACGFAEFDAGEEVKVQAVAGRGGGVSPKDDKLEKFGTVAALSAGGVVVQGALSSWPFVEGF
jgi:hypothetical protein